MSDTKFCKLNWQSLEREKHKARRSVQSLTTWRVDDAGPAVQNDWIAIDGHRPPGNCALDGVAMAWSQLFISVPWRTKTVSYCKLCASETWLILFEAQTAQLLEGASWHWWSEGTLWHCVEPGGDITAAVPAPTTCVPWIQWCAQGPCTATSPTCWYDP